jgi:carboxylesterase
MTTIGFIHGLGGTAATMQPLADALAEFGYQTVTVTLPGHGTAPDDLVDMGWSEWLAAVPHADVLVGQSMGASLALTVAAVNHHVRAVVAINPPMADEDALDGLRWRQSHGHEWVDAPELAAGEPGYTRLPITALIEMVEGVRAIDLAEITARVLLVSSAHDDVVDPLSADVIASSLDGLVTRLQLEHSGHVASLGPEADLLAAAIAEFVQPH